MKRSLMARQLIREGLVFEGRDPLETQGELKMSHSAIVNLRKHMVHGRFNLTGDWQESRYMLLVKKGFMCITESEGRAQGRFS